MQRLALALVPTDMPLDRALTSFRTNTRGLVVENSGRSYLVTASDIADAWNAAVDAGEDPVTVPIGRIHPRHLFVAGSPLPLRHNLLGGLPILTENGRYNLAGRLPTLTEHETTHFLNVFQGEDPQYTVQDIGSDAAIVVTSSEVFADGLQSSVIMCTCVGNPVHRFEHRQLVDPRKCNKPHAVAVNCRMIDG